MKPSDASIRKKERESEDLLQGTLDLLILRTLLFGPMHGHAIATSIEKTSEDVLQVEHGSLYPALNRLIVRGWISSAWGVSKNNRRAKFYRLTAAGRKQLNAETSKWERLVCAITRIMKSSPEES
jgi:PadR family transcriptional regulator, regulatory protein PadR